MTLFRRFLIVTAFLLLATAIFFLYFLYASWGGKDYYRALRVLASTQVDKKNQSERIFISTGKYQYSGIYMGSFVKYVPGVWVWGKAGPRFFRSSEYSVYSYFQMCTPEGLQKIKSGKNNSPTREVTKNIEEWGNKVKTGDFVSVMVSLHGSGENSGKIKEVHAYDWWMFNPALPVDKQCEN